MNKKAIIILGLALIFGAVTAVLINRVLKGQAELNAMGKTKKILVAVNSISIGQQIAPEFVKLQDWPRNLTPVGSLDDPTQAIGRVSLTEVNAGEPVINTRLAPEGSAAGLSAVIPAGMRAMTVKVDEVIGVAGFVSPGTFVDIVATALRTGPAGEATSRVILQHVKVLASGKQIEKKDGGPVEVKTVTLLVTLEQAESLALASNAGKLQLVMRNSVDEDQVNTGGVNAVTLFGGQSQSRPTQTEPEVQPKPVIARSKPAVEKEPVREIVPAPKPMTVEMIRGVERTAVTIQ